MQARHSFGSRSEVTFPALAGVKYFPCMGETERALGLVPILVGANETGPTSCRGSGGVRATAKKGAKETREGRDAPASGLTGSSACENGLTPPRPGSGSSRRAAELDPRPIAADQVALKETG